MAYEVYYKNPNGQLYLRAAFWDEDTARAMANELGMLLVAVPIIADYTGR